MSNDRRGFIRRLFAASGVAAAVPAAAPAQTSRSGDAAILPRYARAQDYKSLKQSSYDRTGGNADYWSIAPGQTPECSKPIGPASSLTSGSPLPRERQSPERNRHPHVLGRRLKAERRSPVGDFFGLKLGPYFIYESAYLPARPEIAELLLRDAVQVRPASPREPGTQGMALSTRTSITDVPSLPAERCTSTRSTGRRRLA